jgi:hypothetical protein
MGSLYMKTSEISLSLLSLANRNDPICVAAKSGQGKFSNHCSVSLALKIRQWKHGFRLICTIQNGIFTIVWSSYFSYINMKLTNEGILD